MMTALLPLAVIGTLPLLILFAIFALICVLLILVILMQKGKGSGLAGLVGGVSASDNMGTPEAQKDLSRYTRNIAVVFFAICIALSMVSTRCSGPEEATGPFTGALGDEGEVVPPVEDLEEPPLPLDDLEASPEVTPAPLDDAAATGEAAGQAGEAVESAPEETAEAAEEPDTGERVQRALGDFIEGAGEAVEGARERVQGLGDDEASPETGAP